MSYDKYELIDVAVAGRVATVTLDNPPINLITQALFAGITLSVYFLAHVNVVVALFRSNAMSVTRFNGYFVN